MTMRPTIARWGVVKTAIPLALLAAASFGESPPRLLPDDPRVAEPLPRVLVVALDAVPYDVVVEATSRARERPLFTDLAGPVPIVSSFPSTTTLAFTGMFEALGLEVPPGYEAKFFDRERRKVRGGGPISYYQIDFSWRDFFDYKVKGAVHKGVGYMRPIRFGRREVDSGIAAFLRSDQPVFFLYISGTDGVAHLKGPKALEQVLESLDGALDRARSEETFHAVILSDHGVGGGEPLVNVRKRVKRAVREEGFRIRKRLARANDLVLVPFGLLSSFVVFVAEGEQVRAVDVLGQVDGVELCAAPEGEGWRLRGVGGEAVLQRRDTAAGREWLYRRIDGDPLDAAALLDRWVPDDTWLEHAAGGRFPDAPHRIARAFDLVRNPASVVCSVSPGHMFGSALTEWGGRLSVGKLRWTHGALERDDTLGFLMTDHPDWKKQKIVRFDEALLDLVPVERLTPPGREH